MKVTELRQRRIDIGNGVIGAACRMSLPKEMIYDLEDGVIDPDNISVGAFIRIKEYYKYSSYEDLYDDLKEANSTYMRDIHSIDGNITKKNF